MTLEDDCSMKIPTNGNKMDVCTALRSALLLAKEQGRLTCGIYESGKMLEINPEGVMLCVLPVNSEEDVTQHIHSKLIEAFCWEHDVKLLKVDSAQKLAKVVAEARGAVVNDNDVNAPRAVRWDDYNCVLIEYPSEESTEDEEDLMAFCKATFDLPQLPVVELAV